MKKIGKFLVNLVKQFNDNELIYMGNELTYKLLLAFFPFLIYIINLLTFLGLKYQFFQSSFVKSLPSSILDLLNSFIGEIATFAESSNFSSIMNFTLFIAIFSSSSGLFTVMRGINRTYGVKDERSYIHQRLLSVLLVLLFSFTLVVTAILIVFSDVIITFIQYMGVENISKDTLGVFKFTIPSSLIVLNIMLVYKIASFKKIKFISTLPGALVCLFTWIFASFVFNFYFMAKYIIYSFINRKSSKCHV